MSDSDRISTGLREAAQFIETGIVPPEGRAFSVRVQSIDVQSIVENSGFTDQEFARIFCVPLELLRAWKNGTKEPQGRDRIYLILIKQNPTEVANAAQANRLLTTLDEIIY